MPHTRPSRLLTTLALLGAASARGMSQPADPPPEDRPDARLNPVLTDPSLQQDVLDTTTRPEAEGLLLPARAPGAAQVVPNQPADPARLVLADGSVGWATSPTLLPEGSFLVRRVGEVVRLRTGGLAFVPAAQPDQPPDPVMPLLPCEVHARLSGMLGESDRGLWVSLTGEVFRYQGRNYLLPGAFAGEAGAPDPTPPQAGAEEAPIEPAPDEPPPSVDEQIEQLVRELEAQRTERRGIDTAFQEPAADAEGAAPAGGRVEGKLLLSRRARMVRGPGGGWIVAIDNDAEAGEPGLAALPERLHLLPCQAVAEMERLAQRRGESWTFEISGSLYRSGERVYILPRLFVSLPLDEVEPLQ